MEKKQKIIQVYAVIICVIAIITVLISLSGLVSAIIDRNDPLHAYTYEVHLTSFENFKMNTLKSTAKDQAYIPDDQTMMKMFQDAKEDKINLVKHQTNRTIIVSSIIISISILLLVTHFWILKKVGRKR